METPDPILSPDLPPDAARVASAVIAATLAAADPARAVRAHWPAELDAARSVRLLAFGKASVPMAAAATERLGDRLDTGVVIAPPEWVTRFTHPRIQTFPADHPLPTERNTTAAAALEACARGADPDRPTLVLISGGGSAHLTAPRDGVTLDQIRETTDRLLRAGADINALNAERRRLERLKAGGLLRACASRRVLALVLSDVLGDDLRTIASGPLVPDTPDPARPPAQHTVIANNATARAAAEAAMRHAGLDPVAITQPLTGEASDAGRTLARVALGATRPVVAAGETTVTVGDATGLGGRNLELALAAAAALPADRPWAALALATDGVDGPTDAAGALFTSEMFADPRAAELAAHALRHHDAYHAAEMLGALVKTGPTGTNVNDIAALWWR